MTYPYEHIKTIQDVIHYWRECVNDAPDSMSIRDKAAWLVGIHHAYEAGEEAWQQWYAEPLFDDLLSSAESLEIEPSQPSYDEKNWQKILDLLAQLEAKYF